MNEKGDEANVPREPWQRLLADDGDGPPETTDARIRANVRRDLAPRGQRWWLPASLAASFVLAVLIVRSEIGTGGRIPIAVTERGGDEAMDARIIDRHEGEQAREPGQAPAVPSRKASKQREDAEPDVYGYSDSELGSEAAGTGPRVGGPERELQAASEMADEDAAALDLSAPSNIAPSDASAPEAPAAASAPQAPIKKGENRNAVSVTAAKARRDSPAGAAVPVTPAPTELHVTGPPIVATPPTPEAWYAAIEKLRRDGRIADANRELERLRKAYPGWLDEHLRKQPKP